MSIDSSVSPRASAYAELSAQLYDLWFSEDDGEARVIGGFVASGGRPVLEVACGTGRLLLPLLERGFDVDGLDNSAAMLAIAGRKVDAAGRSARLMLGDMASATLDRRYGTIFLSLGSLQLGDVENLPAVLRNLRRHLLPGGQALFGTFVPLDDIDRAPTIDWYERRRAMMPDGSSAVCRERVDIDVANRRRRGTVRYEVWHRGRLLRTEDEVMCLFWAADMEYVSMLRAAGFGSVELLDPSTGAPKRGDGPFTLFRAVV